MPRWTELIAEAQRRHGVLTLVDARRCGIPERTLRDRAAAEAWPRLHRGVWALPGTADTPLRDCAAALAAVGPHALVARRSAGWLWQLRPQAPARAEVIIPAAEAAVRRPGIVALRSLTLQPGDAARVHGLTVTSPARTLADLGAVSSPERLLEMVVRAVQRDLVTVPELAAQVGLMHGAPGIGRLRQAVLLLDGGRVDSLLEREVRLAVGRAGLPAPHPEPVWLFGGRAQVDIAWPDRRAGIEVDGFAYHRTADDLARDHRKGNLLVSAGWTVLRIGYLRWRRDREGFLGELSGVLANLSLDSGGYSPEVHNR